LLPVHDHVRVAGSARIPRAGSQRSKLRADPCDLGAFD
jgi:hypothetical protein